MNLAPIRDMSVPIQPIRTAGNWMTHDFPLAQAQINWPVALGQWLTYNRNLDGTHSN